jgi:hypothetical protein
VGPPNAGLWSQPTGVIQAAAGATEPYLNTRSLPCPARKVALGNAWRTAICGRRWGHPTRTREPLAGATHHRLVVEGDKRDSCQGRAAEGLKSPAGATQLRRKTGNRGGHPTETREPLAGATHRRLVIEGDKRGSCQGRAAGGLKSPAGPPNSGERPAGAGATQHEQGSRWREERWRGPPTAGTAGGATQHELATEADCVKFDSIHFLQIPTATVRYGPYRSGRPPAA